MRARIQEGAIVLRGKWRNALRVGSHSGIAMGALPHAALAASNTTPISVTFEEAYPLSGGDQIGSAGSGPYVTKGAVLAELDASGDLHLVTDINGRPGVARLLWRFRIPRRIASTAIRRSQTRSWSRPS